MTTTVKSALSLAGLAFIASGVMLWAEFGQVIAFDLASASFVGCF